MRDFTGFRLGNIHSDDLHLVVVSSSDRYDKNLLPDPTNYHTDVSGGDGAWYFGQTFGTRDFTINVAYDNVTEPIFRKIQQVLANDKLQDLVFDELPYKTFKAKLKSKPEFKHICFKDRNGDRTYKGEGTLQFICYCPYAFGLNKYVVRAADYYRCVDPETIVINSSIQNPYEKQLPKKYINGILKRQYNTFWNMNTPWKGGFPSIEQVQQGELYFVRPPKRLGLDSEDLVDPKTCSTAPNENSLLIDVRGYWDNVPLWESTAKLLTTPTLDYDQELMFMPQYNKINFMNMDTGLNNEQGLIGSRILVYNPGDIPVDFELKLNNIKNRFRADDGSYNFRINRYNVQRLSIENAVDWTMLKPLDQRETEPYKYGNRYFKILERTSKNENGYYNTGYRLLKKAHPQHCYIVEPIPHEKLSHYIKTFYWQSFRLNALSEKDWKYGIDIANRYDELAEQCITEDELYELYWDTLDKSIIEGYARYFRKKLIPFDRESFKYDYFQNPSEYIRKDLSETWGKSYEAGYNEIDFNVSHLPQYLTPDYIELNSDKLIDDMPLEPSERTEGWQDDDAFIPHEIYCNTEKHMLYNIKEPEWKNSAVWLADNPEKASNFYNYKPETIIRNEAIEQGRWFKLPPGWSLISIEPIVDETKWGGKRWRDARPFIWGDGGENEKERAEFLDIYYKALRDYLAFSCPQSIIDKFAESSDYDIVDGQQVFNWDNVSNEHLNDFAHFRRWYGEYEDFYGNQTAHLNKGLIAQEDLNHAFIHKRNENAEYGFLRMLSTYWNVAHLNEENKISKGIDSWWWKASNYIWANFPPLYWGYMDILNSIEIKYTPLFY